MFDFASFVVAFSIGLLGGAHCLGMCGGIMGALTMAISTDDTLKRWSTVVVYNIGRISSYSLIAFLFYILIHQLESYLALEFMRYVAGFLLIAMGLYLANWWRGLVYLEKLGTYLWRHIQPLSKTLLPVKTLPQAFVLGIVWGWLPCGLVYSALAYSATAVDALNAIGMMLAFGLGTLPAVVTSGLLAERLAAFIRLTGLRRFFAILLILFGIWTLWHLLVPAHDNHHMLPFLHY